jgi:hypothetical protein
MPAEHTTRIVWPSEKDIREAKKKQKTYNKKNFSEFVRFAVEQLPPAR